MTIIEMMLLEFVLIFAFIFWVDEIMYTWQEYSDNGGKLRPCDIPLTLCPQWGHHLQHSLLPWSDLPSLILRQTIRKREDLKCKGFHNGGTTCNSSSSLAMSLFYFLSDPLIGKSGKRRMFWMKL